jgi:hypothetical protein
MGASLLAGLVAEFNTANASALPEFSIAVHEEAV